MERGRSDNALHAGWKRLAGRVVDLSVSLANGTPSFPGDPPFFLESHDTLKTAGYNLARITMGTHQGTHVDAPYHFFDDGATVERLDLTACIGPALLVDLSRKAASEPIGVADLAQWAPRIGPGSRVIYRTGWDSRLGQPGYFEGYPSMTTDVARWLAGRGIALLGMDTPSPGVDWKDVHEILLGSGVVILEELANLDQVGVEEFVLVAEPLRLAGADGSPVRALALVPDR